MPPQSSTTFVGVPLSLKGGMSSPWMSTNRASMESSSASSELFSLMRAHVSTVPIAPSLPVPIVFAGVAESCRSIENAVALQRPALASACDAQGPAAVALRLPSSHRTPTTAATTSKTLIPRIDDSRRMVPPLMLLVPVDQSVPRLKPRCVRVTPCRYLFSN